MKNQGNLIYKCNCTKFDISIKKNNRTKSVKIV